MLAAPHPGGGAGALQNENGNRMPPNVAPSSHPDTRTPREIGSEFRALLAKGFRLRPAGSAKRDPERELRRYVPRYAIDLFDTRYYLTDVRQNPDIRFFVAYVRLGRGRSLYPRIFYKDVSLVWRSASHFVRSENENWIGKGDVTWVVENGMEVSYSAEETTDLPLEIQTALETLLRNARSIPTDHQAVERILRRGGESRTVAYADFTRPRQEARSDPRNLVNGGRRIARFTRKHDPASLVFTKGYEPDFDEGILEVSHSQSRLYGGRIDRYRIVSTNRRVQYLFMAGPKQVWIIPPQATSSLITPYGVRAIDVAVDDELCVPAYEFHYIDELAEPPVWVSQIPAGFVGEPSPIDPARCDASPWIDRLPVVKRFRREVLARRR
jgi:hypothetical protein